MLSIRSYVIMLSYTWKTLLIWSWRKFHFFWAGTDTKNLRYYPEESYCCMLLWIILIFSSVSVIHTCGVKYMTGVVDSGFLIQSKQVSFTPRIWFFFKGVFNSCLLIQSKPVLFTPPECKHLHICDRTFYGWLHEHKSYTSITSSENQK